MLTCSQALHSALYNNATITALLGTITGGYPAVFNDNPVPPIGKDVYPSINHYRNGLQSARQEWTDITYIVNCWGRTAIDAQELQETTAAELAYTHADGFRFMATILPVIPVQEDGGVYNGPVEIRVQKNQRIGA